MKPISSSAIFLGILKAVLMEGKLECFSNKVSCHVVVKSVKPLIIQHKNHILRCYHGTICFFTQRQMPLSNSSLSLCPPLSLPLPPLSLSPLVTNRHGPYLSPYFQFFATICVLMEGYTFIKTNMQTCVTLARYPCFRQDDN